MKRACHGFLAFVFAFLVYTAEIIIKPACVGCFYQPYVPKNLLKMGDQENPPFLRSIKEGA